VETAAGYGRYRHGEAVAIGLAIEAVLAERIGLAEEGTAERTFRLLERAGLPTRLAGDVPADAVMEAMSVDKKARDGKVRFVLPERIGRVRIVDQVDREDILQVLESCREAKA